MSRVLALVAKRPLAGHVKTRLAAATTPDFAARVAEAFLRDTVERLATVAARRIILFDPPDAAPFFASLSPEFDVTPQSPGDLGARLAAFVESQPDDARVVLVGADSPTLPTEFVEQAFGDLERAHVVLGPATDGGYTLLALKKGTQLFSGITWGTSSVLRQTVARLDDPSIRLSLLPPWYDVDTLDDWRMLCGHLAAMRRAGIDPRVPRTEALAVASPF